MPSPIEVTVFVPFEYCPDDEDSPSIKGIAEIYGSEDDYDVVRLKGDDGEWIIDKTIWKAIRSDLLQEQYVYDTLKEEIFWEYHAS